MNASTSLRQNAGDLNGRRQAVQTVVNRSSVVHLTQSLSAGLAKQMWEDSTWVLEDREPVKKGRHSRTAWLKHVNQITEGMVPAGHMLWSKENGKGKDRSLTRIFLLPLEDGDFEVEAWIACARDFRIRSFQTDIILTRHLIERMFLRLPTMDRGHVTKNLCPVIRFLIFGTDRWSRRNMPEVFDLLTDYQRDKYFACPASSLQVRPPRNQHPFLAVGT